MLHPSRIYLVGFMGSGKSVIGKKLAEETEATFTDLDQLLEEKKLQSIARIFSKEGEQAFRKKEQTLLHQTDTMSNAVIAVGGGTPCFFDNMEWMNSNGMTVYLQANPEVLYQRLKNEAGKRPLLSGNTGTALRNRITTLLAERECFYLRASCIVLQEKTDDIAHTLQKLLALIQASGTSFLK